MRGESRVIRIATACPPEWSIKSRAFCRRGREIGIDNLANEMLTRARRKPKIRNFTRYVVIALAYVICEASAFGLRFSVASQRVYVLLCDVALTETTNERFLIKRAARVFNGGAVSFARRAISQGSHAYSIRVYAIRVTENETI